ncbi:helix-turn-helix domain-containing protein [Marinobacterium mangrovicola]|uniref:AraC family ethanolamine operon transcriptional activator n=1 Tax=Marinobacterium mangrovicola TaxID=1476959 RepID=A0A4R1GJ22_9GAMM|nr:helix-turn-helix domain-containing protein [Marinobacterium mangrovicola]TCK07191.1 AraC family ethanolamine operon transcriptional activator [Marinobacterium mangrovicola]
MTRFLLNEVAQTSQHEVIPEAPIGSPTLSNAPLRCAVFSDDLNEQAGGITDWQQEYDQVSAGAFHGSIEECHIGALQVFREHTSKTLRQTCEIWQDAIWVGIPVVREGFRINGEAPESCDLLWRRGQDAFELMTPDNSNILSIAVHEQSLLQQAEAQGIAIQLPQIGGNPRIQVDPRQIEQMGVLINRVISASAGSIDRSIHEDLVMQTLLNVLRDAKINDRLTPSHAHRKAVVDRVREHVADTGSLPVTLTELCEIACVSRRTLQYSFESILGINPKLYLRTNRLNQVRRRLSNSETESVSDAAAHYGFYHLSQFATDYKRLFGELPSQTLARRG